MVKHTYEECRDKPKNRKSSGSNRDDNNKKRSHDAHHYDHDERYLSSQDESPEEHCTPEPSSDEGELSARSGESQHRNKENYHVDTGKEPRKKRKVDVARRSATRKNLQNEKPSHSTKHVTDSLFQDELDATTHEKQIADDVTNPFAFK